jgi:hypothetical protein
MSSEMPLARFFGSPAILPWWFKPVFFFGLPWVFFVVVAFWLVLHFTDPFTAVYIVFIAQAFAVGLVAVIRRKLELKELLLGTLILGWPLLLFVIAGVLWLAGYLPAYPA